MRVTSKILLGFTVFFLSLPVQAGTDRWTPFAPGGGLILQLVATPGNLYAGSGAAIHKSTDGGVTWRWSSYGMRWADQFAADPLRPETLYAIGLGQVFRTGDGARSWQALGAPVLPSEAKLLAVGAGTPATLYVAHQAELFRSLDGGVSWTLAYRAGGEIKVVQAHPRRPGLLYLSAKTDGLLQSTDHGNNWTNLRKNVSQLALAPSRPARLYATAGASLWTSQNGGATWNRRALPPRGSEILAVDPASPLTVYAGGREGLAVSRDGGKNWRLIDQGIRYDAVDGGPSLFSFATDPVQPSRIYVGTRRMGVIASPNGGRSWTYGLESGLDRNYVWEVRLSPLAPQTVYAILEGPSGRLAQTRDGGRTWNRLFSPAGEFFAVAPDPASSAIAYGIGFTPAGNQLFRSLDEGTSWVALGPAPAGSIYVANPAVYIAGEGVFRTLDNGLTWSTLLGPSVDVPGCGNESCRQPIYLHRIVVDRTDPAILYAIGYTWTETQQPPIALRSLDGGESWSVILSGRHLWPSPLAVSLSSKVYTVQGTEVAMSEDHGTTWSVVGPFAYGHTAYGLAADPFDADTLYAGTEKGVLRSQDGGRTWSPIGPGLARRGIGAWVLRIEPHPSIPGRIYCLPATGGILELQLTH